MTFSPASPAMPLVEAMASRRSIRAFLDTPVDDATINRILELAARAPSGTNMQPWHVYVLKGEPLAELSRTLERMALADAPAEDGYRYYPPQFREPYLARRRKVGFDMYGLLGIKKGETEKMARQHAENFRFFGAPVGLFFTIDRDLELGSWLDHGMFVQSVCLAARAFGLDTCPQAAFVRYHQTIARLVGFTGEQTLVCGMALGQADLTAPINQLVTERAPVAEFVTRVEKLS